ncbi:MAG: DUF2062 domain-containing protein [Woeseiaceae bacterium]|nr:DUF2062 domain-containing protein [Woeseiaceae bacterium]
MPRRIFKKFAFKRQEIARHWIMTPFRHLLHDPRLWAVRRRWVVPAFALGLFIAWLPFPGHTATAILIALLMRVNIPIAAVSTWVSNPATMGPMYYLAYKLGNTLLGSEPGEFGFELSFDWVAHTFVTIWQPLLLGCVLLGGITALVGYVVVDALWRMSLKDYKMRKRAIRRDRDSA